MRGKGIFAYFSISLFSRFRVSNGGRSCKGSRRVNREGGKGIHIEPVSHDVVPGENSSHAIEGTEAHKESILDNAGFIRWDNPGVDPGPHVAVAKKSGEIKRSSER